MKKNYKNIRGETWIRVTFSIFLPMGSKKSFEKQKWTLSPWKIVLFKRAPAISPVKSLAGSTGETQGQCKVQTIKHTRLPSSNDSRFNLPVVCRGNHLLSPLSFHHSFQFCTYYIFNFFFFFWGSLKSLAGSLACGENKRRKLSAQAILDCGKRFLHLFSLIQTDPFQFIAFEL